MVMLIYYFVESQTLYTHATIAHIGSIQIRIYYDDHGVPHFHAVSPDFDFKISMTDLSVIFGAGHLRGRDLVAIRGIG
jgi:hypothetical protein